MKPPAVDLKPQSLIEAEIKNALIALGPTPQDIAATLIDKGINLRQCCPANKFAHYAVSLGKHSRYNCPVHDYLAQQFPELTSIEVGDRTLAWRRGPWSEGYGEYIMQTPEPITRFIHLYDDHSLPLEQWSL